jgi:hypothetical protein
MYSNDVPVKHSPPRPTLNHPVLYSDLLVTGHFDKTVRVWDPRTGMKPVQDIEVKHTAGISSLSMHICEMRWGGGGGRSFAGGF